jgi:hypothetical protein
MAIPKLNTGVGLDAFDKLALLQVFICERDDWTTKAQLTDMYNHPQLPVKNTPQGIVGTKTAPTTANQRGLVKSVKASESVLPTVKNLVDNIYTPKMNEDLMGEAKETKHIWMQNHQAAISPPWSIHSGCGTKNYSFIWGMAGENKDYTDMEFSEITELR